MHMRQFITTAFWILFATMEMRSATFTVTNASPAGLGSLQQAILNANANPGSDIIAFSIATGGTTIVVTNELPALTDPVTLDGSTQPGYSNLPVIEISGAAAGNAVNGLVIGTSNCVIRAVAINYFQGDNYYNGDGIQITNGWGNQVEGCYLGLARDGVTAAGNAGAGVRIGNPYYYSGPITSNNVVGGATLAARNLISGNGAGVFVINSPGNAIVGNFIGTDATGSIDVGNTNAGVTLSDFYTSDNLIGGTNASQRNLISGNGHVSNFYYRDGVLLSGCYSNAVFGNFIGVDISGTVAIPNGEHGVNVQFGGGNLIGGAESGQGNLISGNQYHGVNLGNYINSKVYAGTPKPLPEGTVVQGNRIGTDVTGTLPLPNAQDGVYVNSMAGNLIGGFLPGEGNLIAFNTNNGVEIFGYYGQADFNEISGNIITANRNNGVQVDYAVSSTAILSNSIYANTNLGIDLNLDGVTFNDLGDGDNGANNFQNFPMLGFPLRFATTTVISGALNSATNETFRIELFDNDIPNPSGYGEGQRFLTAFSVITDTNGDASFSFTNPTALPLSHWITATATDTNGNTSEFSFARQVVDPGSVDLSVAVFDSIDPAPRVLGFQYLIKVTNNGPANATSVVVTNILPAGVSFISATPTPGTWSQSGSVGVWSIGSITAGTWVSAIVNVGATGTGLVEDTAAVSSAESENTPANNTAAESTFLGVADLMVRTTSSPEPVEAGQTVTYSVVVTNRGPDSATSANLNFTVDGTSVVTGATISQGMVSPPANYLSCALGTIPANSAATLTVTAVPTQSGAFYSYANDSAAEFDLDNSNNSTNQLTTVTNGPGVIQFSQPTYSVVEAAGANVVVGVQRTGGAIGTVTANFSTANVSAIAGVNYVTTNGTLIFTNGETAKTFSVAILDDGNSDCNKLLQLHLSNPTGGAVLIGQTNATLEIFDNHPSPAGVVQAVSLANTNILTTGNGGSMTPSISDDGRYVAFNSYANNLVTTPDFNGTSDVFVRDRGTGMNTLVSREVSNTAAGNGYSTSPKLSADGRTVVFATSATDLTTNAVNGDTQFFARNLVTGSNYLVSVNTNGAGGNNHVGYFVTLSTNGSRIAFSTYATDLAPGDFNSTADVYYRDLSSNTVSLVSVNAAGTGPANGYSDYSAISADGRYVAFASYASNISPRDNNTRPDIYRRDLVAGGISALVSINTLGVAGNNDCGDNLFISDDGRYVAFESFATDLVSATPTFTREIFLRDMATSNTIVASVNNSNVAANGYCTLRGLSRDGRYVLFESTGENLFTNDTNFRTDLFVRDTVANTTKLVNINLAGTAPGNDGLNTSSTSTALSSNGRYVSFNSAATDLVAAGKEPGISDAFVRDLQTGVTTLLSTTFDGSAGGNSYTPETAVSANGIVAFGSYASDLAQVDANFSEDIFARANGASSPELLSEGAGLTANGNTFEQQVSADGIKVAFASHAVNIVANDTNTTSDIFLYDLNAHTMKLISANTNNNGTQAGNSDSARPSADGRFVAYHNYQGLILGRGPSSAAVFDSAYDQIFLRDSLSNLTTLVSINAAQTAPGNGNSIYPQITGSGQFVVFESLASDLVPNDINGMTSDAFIRNRTNTTCELVSVNAAGTGSANGDSHAPSVSGDGRFVAFESYASNLGPIDSNNHLDVYVRDRQTGSNILCSPSLAGNNGANNDSFGALVSANGTKVIFLSYASDLTAGGNANGNIFAFDIPTRTLALVSKNPGGVAGNGSSFQPSVSADGRYVAFFSSASDLVAGDSNQNGDVFVRDVVAGTTTLVSLNCQSAGGGNSYSDLPQISANGHYVTFHSYATDLVPGNFINDSGSVFRRDLLAGTTALVSQTLLFGGEANANSSSPTISANGTVVSFLSSANDLVLGDANNTDDAFAWSSASAAMDLAITMSASAPSVGQGGALSYTLTVTNYGTVSATGVVVTDALPASVTFVSATTSQGTFNQNAGLFTANVGNLNFGSGASITLNVIANTVGFVTNTATTSATQNDPNPGNNSASAIVLITPAAAPQLTATISNASQLFVKWPYPSTGYSLQTTTNLAPVSVWSAVTNSVSNNGLINYLFLDVNPNERARFYRLIHP